MGADKEKIILNLKIGVIKELFKKQLITQKQMQNAIDLINTEFKKSLL